LFIFLLCTYRYITIFVWHTNKLMDEHLKSAHKSGLLYWLLIGYIVVERGFAMFKVLLDLVSKYFPKCWGCCSKCQFVGRCLSLRILHPTNNIVPHQLHLIFLRGAQSYILKLDWFVEFTMVIVIFSLIYLYNNNSHVLFIVQGLNRWFNQDVPQIITNERK